ncbi:MAG: histidine kinase dimerization/phosphoacceptor domain -containing protein [Melioribacteraceae bacterium]
MFNTRKLSQHFFLIAFLFAFSVIVPQHYSVRTYTIEDGLPTNVVNDVIQDNSGRMWFATEFGISVYDGTTWTNFSKKDGLNTEYYFRLKNDALGTIWALPQFSKVNLQFYKNDKWFTLPPNPFLTRSELNTAFDIKYVDGKPVLMTATESAVYLFKDNKWSDLGKNHRQFRKGATTINQFNGKFYISTHFGAFITDGFSFDESINSVLNTPSRLVLATGLDSNNGINKLWLLGRDWIGYYDLDIKKFVLVKTDFFLKTYPTFGRNFIVPDKINRLFFGNDREKFFLELSTNIIKPLGMDKGFTSEGSSNAFIDRENNIWIPSTRGVDKITNTPFTNYFRKDGLAENEVCSIEEIGPGEYFFGQNYGFTVFKNDKYVSFNHENRMPKNFSSGRVMDACRDKQGNIYFAATYAGLGKYSIDGKLTWILDSNNGEIGYTAVQFDNKGQLWIGSLNGLYKYVNGKLIQISKVDVRFQMIRQIYFSTNGKIYITSNGGLFNLENNSIVPATNENSQGSYYSIHDYKNGSFLAGKNSGVYLIENKKVSKFKFGSFTIDRKVFFIEKDEKGNFWFGTDDGVFWWNGTLLRRFSMEDGLSGRETNRFAWLNDSSGKIWIGTDRGLSCYQPDYDVPESAPVIQNVFLSDIRDSTYSLKENLVFPFSNNTFRISVIAISFKDEKRIYYRMKLTGFDKEWLSLGTSNSSRYTNLNAGEYRLSIQAKKANGSWSNSYTSGLITIKPPFYVTWWFAGSVAILLFSVLKFIYSYNTQRKYSNQLEKEVALRTKELLASEQKMKALIENSPTLISTLDKSGIIQFINKDLDPFVKNKIVGHSLLELYPEHMHHEILELMDRVFSDKQTVSFSYRYDQFSKPLYLESYVSPIISADGTVDEAVLISLDQTEKKKSEDEIKTIEEKQNAILKAIPIILYNDSNKEGEPVSWVSESVKPITGFTQENYYTGKIKWRERIHPDDLASVLNEFERLKENKTLTLEYRWRTADDKYKWFLDFISPIKTYEDGKVEFFGIWLDINDRKRAQYRLEMLNEYFLKFGADPSKNINKIVQLCGQELNASIALYNKFHGDKLISVGHWGTPEDFNPVDNAEGHICTDLIKSNTTETKFISDLTQTKYIHTDPLVANFGMKTYLGFPVRFGDSTKGSLCVVFDKYEQPSEDDYKFLNILGAAIVIEEERRSALEMLQESVAEKETLLREVYHRVKNNLQVISSLLYLQATGVKDSAILGLLQESQNRVRSMALVHESLYNSKNLNEVELKGYINNLINHLKESYQIINRTNFEVNIEDVALSIDKAIPCGLVINEIITNSFKYGHPEDTFKDLRVSISVRKSESTIKLIIRDNGNGLPDTINFEGKNKTLGINLIQKLTKQLDGTLTYNTDGGAKFTIEFPL